MHRTGILGWFKWETKAQREKREKAYTQRMFPFGEEQRNWEINMIKELFPEVKKYTQEVHYAVLTLREGLLDTQLPEDDEDYETEEQVLNYWDKTETTRSMMKKGYYPCIKAMAYLENAAASLEELPTADMIRAESEKYKVSK